MRALRAKCGFSMVELMLGLGISSLVISGSLVTMDLMQKMNKSVDAQSSINSVIVESNAVLGSANSCTAALAGTASEDETAVVLSPNLRAGGDAGRFLNIDSMTLENVTVLQGATRRADVLIRMSAENRAVSGLPPAARRLGVFYTVDAGNRIQECLGPRIDLNSSCLQLGGIFNAATNTCDFCTALGGTRGPAGTCDIPDDLEAQCLSYGGVWNAQAQSCDFCNVVGGVVQSDGSCETPPDFNEICTSFGGVWTGTQCDLPEDLAGACRGFGGTWDANAQACRMPDNIANSCGALGGTWDGTSCQFGNSGLVLPANIGIHSSVRIAGPSGLNECSDSDMQTILGSSGYCTNIGLNCYTVTRTSLPSVGNDSSCDAEDNRGEHPCRMITVTSYRRQMCSALSAGRRASLQLLLDYLNQ